MHIVSDRKGNKTIENSMQDRILNILYNHTIGRMALKPLISPAFSNLGGKFMDSKASRLLIPIFLRSHSIDMTEFEPKKYTSYNDFFTRKIKKEARPVDLTPNAFISPCDGRLSVYKIDDHCFFSVKHTVYTAKSLLKDKKLAGRYAGGYLWLFRLCVEDYHRYIYVDAGRVSEHRKISGVFHTVNPIANDNFPIYKENTREYSLLDSTHFGTILMMEVGAMLVGKIENRKGTRYVTKGQEKGNFAFGGSTIILMTQAGTVCPDPDILKNSIQGIETKVNLGEKVGSHDDIMTPPY